MIRLKLDCRWKGSNNILQTKVVGTLGEVNVHHNISETSFKKITRAFVTGESSIKVPLGRNLEITVTQIGEDGNAVSLRPIC